MIPLRILPLILAWALLAFSGAGHAQTGDSGLTAQEYYANAERLYADGKYDEAGRLYQKLLDDFGKSKEAEGAIRSIRFRHAMCFVRQRKFGDALEPIRAALAQQPPLQISEIQELQFWLGVAELEEKDFPAVRAALEKFLSLFPPAAEKNPAHVQQYPAAAKIPEARLLIGSAWLMEEKFREAAKYYAGLKAGLVPENRSRAVVLQLYSQLQDNQNDEAMKVIGEEFPRLGEISQLVTFQTLTLELGNRWLEVGEYRKAIACLQRVWPSERLLKHQQQKLAELEERLRVVEASPHSDPYTKFLLGQTIAKVKTEMEGFQKIKSFDAALRLRLATAYQAMKRYREAALILEDMLRNMPPDNVVEQASVNLVQTWFQVGRWPKAIEAADAFRKKFPQSKSIPLVLYLKGLAAQKDLKFDESLAAFDAILKGYKDSEFAPRALFMKGFTLLLAEKNSEAIAVFEKFGKTYPKHELADAAAYWRGMGLSLDKQFAEARTAMDEYLKDFPKGQFAGNAVFRKAYCAQQMEDYKTSIKELRSFMRTYPGHEEAAEARILLGDALMNEGEMEEGMAAFKGIPREETRFYEEGVFKTAKALKLMEEYKRLLDHLNAFQKENPRSPRVAEAIYQIGWVLRQDNKPENARDLYWEAIQEHGDAPSIRSVEDLFPALARLYKGEESAQYLARLRALGQEAGAKGQKTLKMRALWAAGNALKKSDPGQSRALMLEAAALANVQTTNPLLLADFAEALQSAGKPAESAAMYRDLVKWNPRAPQKDRALAALGFAELSNGNDAAAMAWFDRYEKETLGSALVGKVLLAKADLQEKQGKPDEARATLEALLANPLSGGKEKAEALFRIGEIHMASGKPQLAIPYFQRIYVMHGRWADWVAKAYVRSGEAFEKLNDTDSARKTYQELGGKEELSGFPETARGTPSGAGRSHQGGGSAGMKRLSLTLVFSVATLSAQDVLTLRSGETRTGKIAGLDATALKFQVPLPAAPGAGPVYASVSIPRADIVSIDFAPDPALEQLLSRRPGAGELQAAWSAASPWLGIPKSRAARVGNALGNALLAGGATADAVKALEIFQQVEGGAWSPEDRMVAKEGRLRAMVATGRAGDAVKEAEQIASATENPAVLIEAKFILAEAAGASLKKLLEDNPRWEEDANVIPERNRLYHEAVDLFLYPALFEGARADAAARGLWGAVGIYQLAGEAANALECARDITILYPGTKYAAPAKEFIASLPATLTSVDPEKEARGEISEAPQKPRDDGDEENPVDSKPKKKSHETKKTKKS